MAQKNKNLAEWLARRGKMAVALSGGVDSSTLVAFAVRTLGADRVLALSAESPYMQKREGESSRALCLDWGVERVVVEIGLPEDISLNPPERCYLCKRRIFSLLISEASARGFDTLADGTNFDDLSDYRPGMRALKELGISSPFLEYGFGKADVRALAAELSLDCARSPADACLLTRLPHDEKVDADMLGRVDSAEDFIKSLGFGTVRVRVADSGGARIEISPERFGEFCADGIFERVRLKFAEIGFTNVSLDLCGYRRGSMNAKEK